MVYLHFFPKNQYILRRFINVNFFWQLQHRFVLNLLEFLRADFIEEKYGNKTLENKNVSHSHMYCIRLYLGESNIRLRIKHVLHAFIL